MPLFVWAAFGLKALFTSKKLWFATATSAGAILAMVGVLGFAAAKNERLPLEFIAAFIPQINTSGHWYQATSSPPSLRCSCSAA
jgi:hypothetical protein